MQTHSTSVALVPAQHHDAPVQVTQERVVQCNMQIWRQLMCVLLQPMLPCHGMNCSCSSNASADRAACLRGSLLLRQC
eukprot:3782827-Amphidinium_carterae.1